MLAHDDFPTSAGDHRTCGRTDGQKERVLLNNAFSFRAEICTGWVARPLPSIERSRVQWHRRANQHSWKPVVKA
jgi:hypothetical protein